jgi:hypothetical protein
MDDIEAGEKSKTKFTTENERQNLAGLSADNLPSFNTAWGFQHAVEHPSDVCCCRHIEI